MRQYRHFIWLCVAITIWLSIGFEQLVHAQTAAQERNERLQKGQNLSNWLEAYWQNPYPNPTGYTRQSIAQMYAAGMRSLRLPVSFEYYTDEQPPYTLHTDNLTFALIDSAITWAADFDMMLIIDNHHGWEVTVSNYQQLVPRMAAMWKQIAERYAYLDPERYLFELWNEPPILIPEPYIRPFYQASLDSVRTVTTQHSIVIGGHAANLGLALAVTAPYNDNNIIYTFHTYEPYNFTHQGFSWAEPFPFPTGTPFPLNNNDTLLLNTFASVANWQATHNVPVFLGEFGVGVYADAQSRCNWVGLVAQLCRQYNLPWIYWDWQYDFSWFETLPPSSGNMIACFKEALQVYDYSGIGSQTAIWNEVKMYPNPAQHEVWFQIPAGIGHLEGAVYNLLGEKVGSFTLTQATNTAYATSYLTSGMYFVRLNNGKNTLILPLMVR